MVGELFPPRREPVKSYDFADFLTNQKYVTLYGGLLPKENDSISECIDVDDSDEATTTIDWTAQTFTPTTNLFLREIWFRSDVNNIVVQIEETTLGKPNGTVLAVWTNQDSWPNPTGTGFNALERFWKVEEAAYLKEGAPYLVAGTTYAIVFHQHTSSSNDVRYKAAGTHAGKKYDSANSGVDWTEDVGADIYFKVRGSTTNPFCLLTSSFTTTATSTTFSCLHEPAASLTTLGILTFDSKFEISAIIEGDIIIQAKTEITGGLDHTEISWHSYHVNISNTETLMGTSKAYLGEGVRINVGMTKFKKGESLRLKIEPKYFDDDNPAKDADDGVKINYDPETAGNELKVKIPFKTDY